MPPAKKSNKGKDKKSRIDSVTGAAEVARHAGKKIKPPSNIEMTEADTKNFEEIIQEAPKLEWTPHRIRLAALLAKTMTDYDSDIQDLRAEGPTIEGAKGPVSNPRRAAVAMEATIISTMRRSLSIHGRAVMGEARDVAKRRKMGRDIEAAHEMDDDDLLASPGSLN
jgi:hypothetical protein